MSGTSVLIADDHPVFRRGLEMLLVREDPEIRVVGSVGDGREAVHAVSALRPDVVLLDARMPGMDGIEATRILKQRRPQLKIVVLTTFDDRDIVQGALAAGAEGFLLKDAPVATIAHAVRVVVSGDRFLSDAAVEILARPDEDPDGVGEAQRRVNALTIRQQEVLHLLGQGLRNDEIAETLCISERTIRNYVSQIYEIIGIHNRVEAIFWARSHGI